MNYRLDFHEDVENDSYEAYEWYENKTPGLGERYLVAVSKTLEQIAKNPEAFGERSHRGRREAPLNIFPYVIVYKIYKRNKAVFINSIHHTSKHPRKKIRNK